MTERWAMEFYYCCHPESRRRRVRDLFCKEENRFLFGLIGMTERWAMGNGNRFLFGLRPHRNDKAMGNGNRFLFGLRPHRNDKAMGNEQTPELMNPPKKVYFLSDFHLGAPDAASSLEREKMIVAFLEEIRHDAGIIFIVGDMFDFWYEYRMVVPKGHVRLLGKLAELTDSGISIHFFVGNHDMWMKDYLISELNIHTYFEPRNFEFSGKKFLIGHGDGLGPGDTGYKMLKKVFRNPVCQWMFGILPPFMGIGVANFFSRKSREATGKHEETFLGEENEWLITYSRQLLESTHYDFFIFGHRHLPIDFQLKKDSRYVNLGDWITYFTYAVFDGQHLTLQSRYRENDSKIVRQ